MKTIYLIKSILPFVFLPVAPGLVQVELERRGLLAYGSSTWITIFLQTLFTLTIIFWFVRGISRKNQAQEYLKMSCVSKKVFHQGQWISVEQYLAESHNIVVSHGMTPEEYESWMNESEEWLHDKTCVEVTEAEDQPVPEKAVALVK